MREVITLRCPDCSRSIQMFHISPSSTAITLEAICHPCKTIAEMTLTFTEMRYLGEGRSVKTLRAKPPTRVM